MKRRGSRWDEDAGEPERVAERKLDKAAHEAEADKHAALEDKQRREADAATEAENIARYGKP